MPARGSGTLKIVVGVLSVLLTLGFVETLVRFLLPPEPSATLDEFRLTSSRYYERHEVVSWLPAKDVAGAHRLAGSFDSTFRTNSRGLRDREHAFQKPPSVTRIVVLGDSFTWGWGVNDDEVYPAVIESLLKGVEVINLGVTAFGTRQEINYLKLEGLRYQPDTVIVGLCLNDIYDIPPLEPANPPRARPNPLVQTSPIGKLKLWLNHLRLYQLTRRAIDTNKTLVKLLVALGVKDGLHGFDDLDPNLMPALRTYPPQLETAFERTKAELLELRDFLA